MRGVGRRGSFIWHSKGQQVSGETSDRTELPTQRCWKTASTKSRPAWGGPGEERWAEVSAVIRCATEPVSFDKVDCSLLIKRQALKTIVQNSIMKHSSNIGQGASNCYQNSCIYFRKILKLRNIWEKACMPGTFICSHMLSFSLFQSLWRSIAMFIDDKTGMCFK